MSALKFALMVGPPDMADQGGYVRTPVGPFDQTFGIAAELGFEGAELLYGERLGGDIYALRQAISQTHVQIAGFNSGRLFFDHGLVLLCGTSRQCSMTREAIYELIRLAGPFSGRINIGMFRGRPTTADQAPSIDRLVGILQQLADYALHLDVQLLLEPANKKEFPFISSTREGIEIVELVDRHNVGLMLDTFHMMVEEEDICTSLELAMPYLRHIHFLDQDRNPPSPASTGMDIPAILSTLVRCDYSYYLSMPLLKGESITATADILQKLRSVVPAG